MASFSLGFSSNNIEHKVTLEGTDIPTERAVTINGKTYRLLGSDEALQIQCLKVIGAGIYSDEEKAFAASQEGLKERSEDSEFVLAEKSHHSIMLCQPELIAEQILKFFPSRRK